MARSLPTDDFYDDSDGDNDISEVEWTKLKSTHTKEGYRDGYSVGQEEALQPAFNQSFAQHVRKEASVAFYRGVLTALNAFVEKSNTLGQESQGNSPRVDTSQIAALLAELDSFESRTNLTERSSASTANEDTKSENTDSRNKWRKELSQNIEDKFTSSSLQKQHLESKGGSTATQTACSSGEGNQSKCMTATHFSEGGSAVEETDSSGDSKCVCTSKGTDCSEGVKTNKGTTCCRDNPLKKQTEGIGATPSESEGVSHSSEGVIVSDETACCSAFVATSQQDNSEENLSKDESKQLTESDHSLVIFRRISEKCKQLLNELGIEEILQSNPFVEI